MNFKIFQEFTLAIIFAVSPKNDNLDLKMKKMKFFGIWPTQNP